MQGRYGNLSWDEMMRSLSDPLYGYDAQGVTSYPQVIIACTFRVACWDSDCACQSTVGAIERLFSFPFTCALWIDALKNMAMSLTKAYGGRVDFACRLEMACIRWCRRTTKGVG